MKRDRNLAAAFHGGGFRRARRYGTRVTHAGYLATRFTRDDAIPFGPHAGTPIKSLPDDYLYDLISHGLRHAQLYALVVRERDIHVTHRQIGGGC